MKEVSKERFVSDISMHDNNVMVRKPFRISTEDMRRFVRLEVATPVTMRVIKDSLGNFEPDGGSLTFEGNILNVSPGGVLVELDHPLAENDIVLIDFRLQDVESIQNVLGIIQRVERDDDTYMDGIEFVTRKDLVDRLSQAELDLITPDAAHFQEKILQVLERYLYCAEPDHKE